MFTEVRNILLVIVTSKIGSIQELRYEKNDTTPTYHAWYILLCHISHFCNSVTNLSTHDKLVMWFLSEPVGKINFDKM